MTNSKGTLWVSLFIDRNTGVYVDSFGHEYISQEVLIKMKHESINQKISKIQSDDSVFGVFLYRFHRIYGRRKKFVTLYQFIFY